MLTKFSPYLPHAREPGEPETGYRQAADDIEPAVLVEHEGSFRFGASQPEKHVGDQKETDNSLDRQNDVANVGVTDCDDEDEVED